MLHYNYRPGYMYYDCVCGKRFTYTGTNTLIRNAAKAENNMLSEIPRREQREKQEQQRRKQRKRLIRDSRKRITRII